MHQAKNLYQKTSSVHFTAPRLEDDVNADVVIIGGGYTGLSTALHLAEQNISSIVLEAGEIGYGCSGRNGGQVNPGLKHLPDETEKTWGQERGRKMVALAYAAPDEVFSLIEKHGIDCNPVRFGTVCAALDEAGLQHVRAAASQSQRRHGPIRFIDSTDIYELTGTRAYKGGFIDPRGGNLNPLAYARGMAAVAQCAGAKLYEKSEVKNITRIGHQWHIKTGHGKVIAPELVIATNGYTGDLWPGLRRTILPVYTYITATEPLPEAIRSKIIPGKVSLYESAWDVVYYRLDEAGRLLMGGRGAQKPPASQNDYVHLVRYAEKLWPQLKGISWPFYWYGQVAVTKDHFPYLIAPEPGIHLMLGYSGRGIAMATVSGRLVAQRIVSGGQADVALPVRTTLDPIAFHSFWRIGAEALMRAHILKDFVLGR